MADTLQELRAEYVDLSKRLGRVATLTLSILLISVIAYVRAFERIGGHEVKSRLERIQKLIDQTSAWRDVSYVFRWSLGRSAAITLEQPAEAYSGAMRELVDEVDKLEQEASVWFTVKFSMFGASIEGDLRYWIIFLPLFLLFANIYLFLTGAKIEVVRRIGEARLPAGAQPLDALLFGEEKSAYARYPMRFGSILYVLTSVALIAYLLIEARPIWRLWTADVVAALIYIGVVLISWTAAYVVWIREKLRRQAEAIASLAPISSRAVQLYRWLCSLPGRLRAWAARAPRVTTLSGATLLLLTLLLPMAKDCNGTKVTGKEIAVSADSVGWFIGHDIFDSFGDLLGPWVYCATIVVGAVTLIAVLIFFAARSFMLRYARVAAPVAQLLACYVAVDVGFGYPIDAIMIAADVFRLLLFVVPLVLWIRWPHMKREKVERRRARLWSLLVAASVPALIRGPIALVELAVRGLPGIAAYVVGVTTVALGLDAMRREVLGTGPELVPSSADSAPT